MYNHHRMGSRKDLFGQLWKEYALSDSRYMYSDPFVLCMETWTAVRILKPPLLHLLTASDHMGPIIILDSGAHHKGFALPARKSDFDHEKSGKTHLIRWIVHPSPGFDWSVLWRLALLYDQSVR
jgi:cholestenol Delta-isomerase